MRPGPARLPTTGPRRCSPTSSTRSQSANASRPAHRTALPARRLADVLLRFRMEANQQNPAGGAAAHVSSAAGVRAEDRPPDLRLPLAGVGIIEEGTQVVLAQWSVDADLVSHHVGAQSEEHTSELQSPM